MNNTFRTFAVCSILLYATANTISACVFPDVYWTKFDEYSNISWRQEQKRLGYFIIQLRNEADAHAYLVVYAGRRSCEGEARLRAERAKNQIVGSGALSADRITVIDAGYREHWSIALGIGPIGGPPLTKEIVKETEWSIPKSQAKILRRCENALYHRTNSQMRLT